MTQGTRAICIPTYFADYRIRDWPLAFMSFAENAARLLGVRLTHFMCDYEGPRHELRQRQGYRFTERNLARFRALLDEGIELTSLMFDQDTDGVHMDAIIEVGRLIHSSYLYVECSTEPMQQPHLIDRFELFASLLIEVDAVVDATYSLVTRMPVAAMPMYYFANIGIPGLSAAELLNQQMWYNQGADHWHKVRGVYWGNLLSRGHLEKAGGINTFIAEITPLVGTSHVREIGKEKIFFMLPDMDGTRRSVEQLLDRRGILMHPTEQDRLEAAEDAELLGEDE